MLLFFLLEEHKVISFVALAAVLPVANALLHHHNYSEGKHCEMLSRLGYKGGINVKSYFFFQKGLLYS